MQMADQKHLTFDQRLSIEAALKEDKSFHDIARALDKDPSTISKEIRKRRICQRTGSARRNYNSCSYRFQCDRTRVCSVCHSVQKYKKCSRCSMCNRFCRDFRKAVCPRLEKPPYVCNGCRKKPDCTLEKYYYDAKSAHEGYNKLLIESRTGIPLSEAEVRHLDGLVSPLIRQGQSPHHVCVTNSDSIMVSERTIYRYIDARILSAMNLDLQRKVRFSARKQKKHYKVDKACRIGRTHEDFIAFMKENPDCPVTELDSVEGKKGGKVLLTIHFKKTELMLAFLRDFNDSQSVIRIFNRLHSDLGTEDFMRIFKVCLADNGSEFSNPRAIEYDSDGNARTKLFYCDPSAPYQKGSAERNHELIRLCIPKGEELGRYSPADIALMMDHINSYSRPSLGDKCPYDAFAYFYGRKILDSLGCRKIPAHAVTLNKSVFKKEGDEG